MLDSTPLGKLAHRRRKPDIGDWFDRLRHLGAIVIVPEISDFEVRRNLLVHGYTESRAALDQLKFTLAYAPLTTSIMLKAAELWADARRRGRPTADPKELDGDVILAAQALDAGAIIATENVGHLSRYVPARHWRQIAIS